MIFRWAIGDINTSSMKKFSADSFNRFLRMAKTSILSFQKFFPNDSFVVIYNGDTIPYFIESFKRCSPSLLKNVEILDAAKFPMKYNFLPNTGVWWKWIPFRLDEKDTEISLDTDIICLDQPQSLLGCIERNSGTNKVGCVSDRINYFCEDVCGNLFENPSLSGRIPINSGLLVLPPNVTFEEEFIEATRLVQYGSNKNSDFLDEQGCINIGLYSAGLQPYFFDRETNIFGNELMNRIQRGTTVETCHFIAKTKKLFNDIEPYIFRKIYDDNYAVDDFYGYCFDKCSSYAMGSHFSTYYNETRHIDMDLQNFE